jgi:hypothetical protein
LKDFFTDLISTAAQHSVVHEHQDDMDWTLERFACGTLPVKHFAYAWLQVFPAPKQSTRLIANVIAYYWSKQLKER